MPQSRDVPLPLHRIPSVPEPRSGGERKTFGGAVLLGGGNGQCSFVQGGPAMCTRGTSRIHLVFLDRHFLPFGHFLQTGEALGGPRDYRVPWRILFKCRPKETLGSGEGRSQEPGVRACQKSSKVSSLRDPPRNNQLTGLPVEKKRSQVKGGLPMEWRPSKLQAHPCEGLRNKDGI